MKKRIFSLIFSLLFVFLMLPVQTQASTTKNISQTGINFIEAFEGFSKYAYWDHKQYTIGYGTKCEKNEYPNGITEKKAQELLTKTLPSYEGYVNTFLSKHKIKITQNQFDALVSFTYNFGNVWSSSNDFTLRTYLIKGISKYSNKEITKSFTNWSNAGGVRSEGLFNRRKAEAKLFLSKDPVPGEETWVVKESVSIRKSPSTTASKIGEFARGSVLKVVSKNQIGKMLWGEIVYKDSAAWVCLEYSEYSKLNFTSSNSLWKPIVLKIENDLSGIKITWEKVNNSKSYQVLRKSDSSKFSVIGTTNSSTTSFTDTKVTQNKKYTYSIKAIGEKKSSDYNQKGYSLTHLKAVSTLKAVVKNKAISLSWKKQSNATGYQIFKKVGNGEFESLTEVGNSSIFTDKKISPNQTYTYLIKAFNSSAVSGYNEKQATAFYLAAPKINGANTASGIKLSFKKVELAKEYILYRKDSQDSAYKKYKTLKTTSLLDKNVSENILYSYKLKIVKDKTFSDYGEEFAAEFVKNPKLIGIINEKKGVQISWKTANSVSGFKVYRKTSQGSFALIKTINSPTSLNYVDRTAKSGKTYSYSVQAFKNKYSSSYSAAGLSILCLKRPAISEIKKTSSGLKLSWSKVEGAKSYIIFQKQGDGSLVELAKTSKISITVKNISSSENSTFFIQAISGEFKSSLSVSKTYKPN